MAVLFSPYAQRSVTLRNRIVVSPMCMYSAGADGVPTDFHLVHLGARAVGGAGLVISEATAVEPRGRLSLGDLGLWNGEQAAAFARIARFVQSQGARFGIQLAHAGRKAWSGMAERTADLETPVAPSAIPYDAGWPTPMALDHAGIDAVVAAFASAAARAAEIGCDMVEIHAAHGYLIHEFLSPLSNRREDEYGGPLENRARFLRRVYEAVRAAFPADRPVWVRISATDWVEGGWDLDQSVQLAAWMKEWGVDLVDCSSGGLSPLQQIQAGPGYQVPFAARIRQEAGIATGAVGLIVAPEQAERILAEGQADVVLLAREFLRNPHFPLHAAHALQEYDLPWPVQYRTARPRPPKPAATAPAGR